MAFWALDNEVFTCLSPLACSDPKPCNCRVFAHTNLSSGNAHHHSISLLIFSRPLPTLHCHFSLNFIDSQGGPDQSKEYPISLYQFILVYHLHSSDWNLKLSSLATVFMLIFCLPLSTSSMKGKTMLNAFHL